MLFGKVFTVIQSFNTKISIIQRAIVQEEDGKGKAKDQRPRNRGGERMETGEGRAGIQITNKQTNKPIQRKGETI